MRLIDADEYIEELCRTCPYETCDKKIGCYEVSVARSMPTVDVVPTEFHDKCLQIEIQKRFNAEKHGHWSKEMVSYKDQYGNFHFGYECSRCKSIVNKGNYCLNCGAKMDKDEWQEPEINPCRGCDDYDGQGGCESNGGCMPKSTTTVNRGRWIKVEDDYNNHLYECSNCHTWTSLPTEEVNDGNIRYCWNCGARMNGVTDGKIH